MKVVLFDLGNTLEIGDVLRPGARETLEAIAAMRDDEGQSVATGLVSDFDMPTDPADVSVIQQRYYDLIDHLGIRDLFEPVAQRVTLSTEVGLFKPAEAVFRTAVTKADPVLVLADALFVTENHDHALTARDLGMRAAHIGVPGGVLGEVEELRDLIPLVRDFVGLSVVGHEVLATGAPVR